MSPTLRPLTFALALLAAAPVLAQDDEPIPYPDDEEELSPRRRKLPPRSDPTYTPREETEVEQHDREVALAHLDDPNFGFGLEALGGVMFVESSRGALVEPRLGAGVRAVWEVGRLMWDEVLREGLFVDLSWKWAALHDGTSQIFADTHYHYVTAAPAFGLSLFGLDDFIGYLQVGGGAVIQYSSLHFAADRSAPITGVKPALVYGVGIRGRPSLSDDGRFRLALRLELLRFRRHYMDDTYLGASVGAAF